MAKKPAAQAISEAAAAINTLSVDAGVGGALTKTWAHFPVRRIYRMPSRPDGVQIKKGHMQLRFGGLYVSQNLDGGLTEIEMATLRLAYEKAKAAGTTNPSYSGSGEPYVVLTVTDTVSAPGGPATGGIVQLDGVTVLTFELDPTVQLSAPPIHKGVYSDGHPGTGYGADDVDGDEDDEDEGDGDDD